MKNKVLIIEDDMRSRKLARDIVTSIGLKPLEADTAEEGIKLAISEFSELALVLLDLRLPGIKGDEALKILRADERTSGIPVVCITASVLAEDRQALARSGFDRVVAKPYHFMELTALIEEFLGIRD